MRSTAIRTKVTEPTLQAYIQQYPFLTGTDENMNMQAMAAIRSAMCTVVHDGDDTIRRVAHAQLDLSAPQRESAIAILRSIGLDEGTALNALHDFGWRVNQIPSDCTSVLCLGSGTGEELAFIRAKAPNARIVVMDYVNKIWPGLLVAVNAKFKACDFVSELATSSTHSYELVFSNHTLEHMFDPDYVLGLIHQRLLPGGRLVSGIPLDGDASTPLLRSIFSVCQTATNAHSLDMGVFDAGHPWKTNAVDLRHTLQEARFLNVQILQRSDVPYRSSRGAAGPSPVKLKILLLGHASVFKTLRLVAKNIFSINAPLFIRRTIVALERRASFGANRLKNSYSPDIVFCAQKSSN